MTYNAQISTNLSLPIVAPAIYDFVRRMQAKKGHSVSFHFNGASGNPDANSPNERGIAGVTIYGHRNFNDGEAYDNDYVAKEVEPEFEAVIKVLRALNGASVSAILLGKAF